MSMTEQPVDNSPDVTARESISPPMRESRAIATLPTSRTVPAALLISRAMSVVMVWFMIPRTPFVPNMRPTFCGQVGDDLRVSSTSAHPDTDMPALGHKKDKEYERAAMLLATGKIEQAIARFRDIISKNPTHTNAMVSLAVALMETQDTPEKDNISTKEALELLDKAASTAANDPVPLFNKGVCLRNIGMPEEALTAFQAALDREKKLPLAILHMAEIDYELGRWDKAVELARLALVRDPGLEEALGWVPDAVSKAAKQKGEQDMSA